MFGSRDRMIESFRSDGTMRPTDMAAGSYRSLPEGSEAGQALIHVAVGGDGLAT